MKKLVLVLTIISILGMAFALVFSTEYTPLTFTEVVSLFAESDISFADTINSYNRIREKISDMISGVSSYPSVGGGDNSGAASREDFEDGEDFDINNFTIQGAIEWIWKKIKTYFNLVLDFFTLMRYTIELIVVFALDTLGTVTSLMEIFFKLLGLSKSPFVPDIL